MLNNYEWYRRWRGGYWVYWYFIGWKKVTLERFVEVDKQRMSKPEWSMENYTPYISWSELVANDNVPRITIEIEGTGVTKTEKSYDPYAR